MASSFDEKLFDELDSYEPSHPTNQSMRPPPANQSPPVNHSMPLTPTHRPMVSPLANQSMPPPPAHNPKLMPKQKRVLKKESARDKKLKEYMKIINSRGINKNLAMFFFNKYEDEPLWQIKTRLNNHLKNEAEKRKARSRIARGTKRSHKQPKKHTRVKKVLKQKPQKTKQHFLKFKQRKTRR